MVYHGIPWNTPGMFHGISTTLHHQCPLEAWRPTDLWGVWGAEPPSIRGVWGAEPPPEKLELSFAPGCYSILCRIKLNKSGP